MSDLGPLFGWSSGEVRTSATRAETASEGPDLDLGKGQQFREVRKVPEGPDSPDLKVRNHPDLRAEKPNDSAEDPRSGIHPYGGDESGPSVPPVPPLLASAAGRGGPQGNKAPVLRPYQQQAISAAEDHWRQGVVRTLLVLPTGTGKTVVFAELARREVARGGRVLVLAHRTELLDQAANKLAAVGMRATLEQGANRASATAPVVVASVQTLRGARLTRFAPDAFALVIVDEAHHATAASYLAILEHFTSARVLGVTATPDRGDGRGLSDTFDSCAFHYGLREAIRAQYLAPIVAKRVKVGDLDLSRIRSHHGDFDQGQLAELLTREKNLHGVVSPLLELAGARRTVVFAVDVAHARALAEVINRHRPAAAIAVDGKAKPGERAAALSLFRAGTFQFLVNCALFTEGFDEPSVACVAVARPTQSRGLYTQMIGRGTRLHPGKADVLVLDFVGNSRHPLIGPADALAGSLDEATRAEVEARLDRKAANVEDVLAEAEAAARAKASELALVAVTTYRTKEINPFLGEHLPPLDPSSPAAQKPATEKQLEAIEKAGLGVPPPGLTLGEASRILDGVAARRKAGLCTIPQGKALARLNLDASQMTFERARELIARAQTRGWRPYNFIGEPEYGRKARSA